MDALSEKSGEPGRTPIALTEAFAQSLRVLRDRRFAVFCFASLLSNLGTWAQQIAQPWLLLTLGASSFLIGMDAFAAGAPIWLLTVVGGILADRWDRRRLVALCQSIQLLCPLTLVAVLLTDTVQPWMVIGLSAIVGVTDALSLPSFQTIVPSMVARDQIGPALAVNATQFNLSRILGPAIGGVLMASVGALGCFALNAISYLPFLWVALWILPRGPVGARDHRYEQQHLFAGIRDIVRHPQLRGALLTVLITSTLCAPLVVFCPVLVKTIMNRGVGDFSLSIAAFGVGGLLGAIALLGVSAGHDHRRISAGFAGGYGLILILAALTPWFWSVPVLLVFAGVSMAISNISANTLLQATTPPELRGEAVSFFMLAMRGGVGLGGLLTGLGVSAGGVQEALLFDGAIAVLAQLLVARRWLTATAR